MISGAKQRVAVLDIGSSKMCCFIADIDDGGEVHIKGIGHQVTAGVKAGVVTDLTLAEHAIRSVVTHAEDMAGEAIDSVIISLTAGRPRSEMMSVEVSVAGHAVERADIDHVMRAAQRRIDPEDRALVHVLPTCYSVDDAFGIRNPEGMYGERLGLDLHLVTAEPGPIMNLESAIQRGHLNISGVVAAPYASGLACLHDQEKQLGAACVDIGGGVTSISVFYGGTMVECSVLPMGGQTLTLDIAKTLGVSLADAERLKTLHGSVLMCEADRRETVEVTPLVDMSPHEATQNIRRARIVEIIRPRLEEMMEHVATRLRACGFLGPEAGTVVFTGGSAQLTGLNHFAEHLLNCPVRSGYPLSVRGLAEATSGPAFATSVGLLLHAAHAEENFFSREHRRAARPQDWPGRVVQWLRQAF